MVQGSGFGAQLSGSGLSVPGFGFGGLVHCGFGFWGLRA